MIDKKFTDKMNIRAVVCMETISDREQHFCRIVKETPKYYRIAVDKPIAFPPKSKLLMPGETKLVPKFAVRIDFIYESVQDELYKR